MSKSTPKATSVKMPPNAPRVRSFSADGKMFWYLACPINCQEWAKSTKLALDKAKNQWPDTHSFPERWCSHLKNMHLCSLPIASSAGLWIPIFAKPLTFAAPTVVWATTSDNSFLSVVAAYGSPASPDETEVIGLVHRSANWRTVRNLYIEHLDSVRLRPNFKLECSSAFHRETAFGSDWANPKVSEYRRVLTDVHNSLTHKMCTNCLTSSEELIPDV